MFSEKNNYVDSMLAYINRKYPEDHFQFVSITGGGVTAGEKTIIVSSQKYSDKEIYVSYHRNKDGEHYSDNYLGVIYADNVRTDLEAIIGYIGGDFKLFYYPDRFACPNDNGWIPYGEYAVSPDACIGFSAIVQTRKTKTEIEESLKNALSSSAINCWGTIYLTESREQIDLVDEAELSSFVFHKDYYAALTIDTDDLGSLTVRWE